MQSSIDNSRQTLALFNKDWNTFKTNWITASRTKLTNPIYRDQTISLNGGGFKAGITSLFNSKDVNALNEYNRLMQAGISPMKAYKETMMGCTDEAKKNAVAMAKGKMTLEQSTGSMKSMSLSAKAGSIALKGLAIAGNILVFMAISKAIQIAVKAFDDYIHRVERASEATKEAIQNYESISSEVGELESKLKELNDQINELDPITDADDIANLQEETKELETQLAILKEKQRIADSDADKAAQESLGMREKSKYETVDVKVNYGYDTVKSQAYVTKDEELLNAIEAYKEYKQTVDDANEALANMASTGEYTKEEWNAQNRIISEYSQKMEDARTHANELAQKINEEKEGLNGLTDKSQSLIDKTESVIETYNNFLDSINGVTDALNEQADAASNVEESEPKWDLSTTFENLNELKEKMDVLDKSFAKLFDKDESIGFEDLSSIHEAFKDLDDIDNYIHRIQEAGQNTEELSQIFGELTGAYLEHTGVLSNVTEENRQLIISMLEEMGVANAEEIVLAQLGETAETLALKKQFLTKTGYELVDATLEEVAQFLNEVDASNEAKQALAQLALEKMNLSNIDIRLDNDVDQLISLANAAGASAMAIVKAKQAIATINSINEKGANGSAGDFKRLDYATQTLSQIKNNTYDWQYQKLNANDFKVGSSSSPKYTPKYTGGSSTNKAIEQAKKDAESEAKKAAEEAENQFKETIDYFERRVKVLENAFNNLEKGMENVFGADAKNMLLSAQIGILDEEINNYTDALAMYKEKADDALSGVDSDLRDKIVDGAVQITDFIGDGNEEVVDAMEAYEGWADKVAECTQKLEELKTQIRQLELQKFNNIVEDFTNQFDIRDDAIDLIEKQIGLLEEAGQLIGESFYTKKIEQSQKQLNTLEAEKARLIKQMNEALTSGRIQKGTDEWLSMVDSLSQVEGSILDCKTAIEEFDNALLELNWQIFERVQTEFGNIASELENLAGLFDDFNDIRVSDGRGTWTDQAIATLGLYAQQYELARYQVGEYSEAIDKLNKDYAAGRYSATEYADKLADLNSEQWNAVNAANAASDSILKLNETRVNEEIKVIEDEIDAYDKLTQSQIKALEAAQNLHEYELSIAEKTKSIADIERQLAAMQNDNTAATIAKKKQLEAQLAEAKADLEEYEYQHSIEAQKDALNKNYEQFEEERNKEIEALRLTLENREKLIADSLEVVKANASTVGEQIALIAQEHGVVVSDAIISSWKSGENAIASYGAVLSEQSSAFIGNIIGVQEYVYGLQAQANSTADSLSWMFSTRADTLVNELVSSYNSEANLNAMTNTLQNSLINTLERGYNINSISSALSSIASGANAVASAANNAAQALANMGAAQSSYGSGYGSGSGNNSSGKIYSGGYDDRFSKGNTYSLVDANTGRTVESGLTYAQAWEKQNKITGRVYNIKKMAKGGIITKDKNNPFNSIAESLGEDAMFAGKEGEGVLTKEQTQALTNFTPILENFTKTWNPTVSLEHYNPDFVRNDRPNVTLKYDSLIKIQGDVNDTKHFIGQMEKTAQKCINKTFEELQRDMKYSR